MVPFLSSLRGAGESYLAAAAKAAAPVFEPLGFGDSWVCVASLPAGIAAKESIVGFLQPHQEEITARPIDLKQMSPA